MLLTMMLFVRSRRPLTGGGSVRWLMAALLAPLVWQLLFPTDNRPSTTRQLDRCMSAMATAPGIDGYRIIPSTLQLRSQTVTVEFGARRSSEKGWNNGELIRIHCTANAEHATLRFLSGT
ncbi:MULTISPECIES: hypothetical protein [Deinococcus]|uniref:hypothetical protein n=1 Tax=Deinococcus TaxID=1298 RepID=UPI0015558C6A|nr:hypothetical protein [Deinococcus indicus]